MRSLFLILFSLATIVLKAQNLQGKVIDEVTGDGVPFASIGVVGTNTATVTNENGDFVLKIADFPAKLRVSHVSYLVTEVTLNESRDKFAVSLKPASISLDIVTIDPFVGQRIVRQALEKATVASSLNFYSSAFYRQLTSVDGAPNQIYELFYSLKWNTKRVQGWIPEKTRFAQNSNGKAFSLENMSYLTFLNSGYLFPERNGKFVNLKSLSDYQIVIEKYIEQSSQKIAVISCKFKNAKRNLYYVNSTYYIGMDDFKIYRVENSLFNLPMKFTYATPKYPPIVSTIATFNGTDTAIPVLESVATKLFLKLDAGGQEMNSNLSSLLIVYKLDGLTSDKNYQTLDRKTKDRTVIESIKYDADFWKDNPIVKQTALEDAFIKMMESKSAFGTMINPN